MRKFKIDDQIIEIDDSRNSYRIKATVIDLHDGNYKLLYSDGSGGWNLQQMSEWIDRNFTLDTPSVNREKIKKELTVL